MRLNIPKTRKVLASLVGVIVFAVLWQLASTYVLAERSTLPEPLSVLKALREMWHSGELLEDVLASLSRIVFGFTIALMAATILGITAARYGRIYDFISVTMNTLSSIPPIEW